MSRLIQAGGSLQTLTGAELLDSIPFNFGASQNDLQLPDFGNGSGYLLNPLVGGLSITGIQGASRGRVLRIANVQPLGGNSFTLVNQSGASLAGNQMYLGGSNLILPPQEIVDLMALTNGAGWVLASSTVAGGSGIAPANPIAAVGLTAVNGAAATYLRSDGAPALQNPLLAASGNNALSITNGAYQFGNAIDNPSYSFLGSGTATFHGAVTADGAIFINSGTASSLFLQDINAGANDKYWIVEHNGTATPSFVIATFQDNLAGAGNNALVIARNALAITAMTYGNATDNPSHTFFGAIGVNGNAPPAQSTGWGTPTGGAVIANFPGATATILQTSEALSQVLTVLKSLGFLGA